MMYVRRPIEGVEMMKNGSDGGPAFCDSEQGSSSKEDVKDKAFVKPATDSNVLCLRNERNQT